MNDDFLTQYYQEPSKGFTLELYDRISKEKPSLLAGRLPFRNATLALVTIILIAACISKAAASRWNKIGDVWVPVQTGFTQDSYLWFTFHPQEVRSQSQIQESASLPTVEKDWDCIIAIPTWAPGKFTTDGAITLYAMGTGARQTNGRMTWLDPSDNQKSIDLILLPLNAWVNWNGNYQKQKVFAPYTSSALPGSFQEVKLNGQPAVLIQGDWIPVNPEIPVNPFSLDVKWDSHAALSLYWTKNDVEYLLYTTSSAITSKDLIKMAESAQ
jgi:hypothetical protein